MTNIRQFVSTLAWLAGRCGNPRGVETAKRVGKRAGLPPDECDEIADAAFARGRGMVH